MCGRFSLTGDLDFYAEYFAVDEVVTPGLEKRWNVAPTDPILVVAERDDRRLLGTMRWGLLPHWVDDPKERGHINARVETVATNNTFRDSFARRRCLIPADGFYEWEPREKGRHPHWIYRADGHPMVFAGIWSVRKDPATGEWLRSCAIITRPAEGVVASIHDRMPAVVPREAWATWLDRQMTDPEAALDIIREVDTDALMEHRVSRAVNSVRNDGPHLVEPAEPETLF
ncbi:MAG: SOS response-associated peptidase [Actinomycetes bacterium]|jgi:putative SOS response-associated peptidase YedK